MKKLFLCLMTFLLCSCQKRGVVLSGIEYLLKQNTSSTISLVFDEKEGRFSGFGGVNRYFGQYKTDGKNITLSQVGATMMMGSPEDMENERRYFEILGKVSSFEIDGNKLILKTPKETLTFLPKAN